MTTQLIAHYSNWFDTYAGRKAWTDSEILATLDDEYLAREILGTVAGKIAEWTDIPDYVEIALVTDGVEIERTVRRKTGAYDKNAKDYAKSWQE